MSQNLELPAEPSSIRFTLCNESVEAMRFEENGDIFVHGRLVENDKEVVDGLRDFLAKAQYIHVRNITVDDCHECPCASWNVAAQVWDCGAGANDPVSEGSPAPASCPLRKEDLRIAISEEKRDG